MRYNRGMCRRRQIRTSLTFVALAAISATARADVVVLANRTPTVMSAVVTPTVGTPQRVLVSSGESVPVFVDGRAHVDFASRGRPRRYQLDANCAYYFGRAADGGTDLQKIGLGEDASTVQGRTLPGSAAQMPVAVIPVKILVDEEETARQIVWERRLRQRIEAASMILERTCGVRLKVVEVGVWFSDNVMTDFYGALSEFEREANPLPARVAIGFTSQFAPVVGRTHMAGTRGPLHQYILCREGAPQINESEKLEFLVHELGHFLGASHSPENTSVMRPVLGDNRAGKTGYRIRFDAVNTLAMSMVSEELRRNRAQDFSGISADTKRRLRQIYGELARAFPDDPASKHYVALTQSSGRVPLAAGTKHVLDEIVRAAIANKALSPAAESSAAGGETRREGDALTNYYVRRAAAAAKLLPADSAGKSFLLAIGIGLGDSNSIAAPPVSVGLGGTLETPRERAMRMALLGEPTIHGRRDLAQHFFVSASLAASTGAVAAEAAGMAKELLDANGGTGFSFADLAADRAGVEFARRVMDNKLALPMLAHTFSVPAFVPAVKDLPENLNAVEFAQQFSGKEDDRFQKQLHAIDQRILNLPPYRSTGPTLLIRP